MDVTGLDATCDGGARDTESGRRLRGGEQLSAGGDLNDLAGSLGSGDVMSMRNALRVDPATMSPSTWDEIKDYGIDVHISHFPYADPSLGGKENRHGEVITDKFAPWRVVDEGGWLLCGHVHDSWRQKGRMINVGVDAWGGRPVSEAEIVELIGAGPRDLGVLSWSAT